MDWESILSAIIIALITSCITAALSQYADRKRYDKDIMRFKSETSLKLTIKRLDEGIEIAENMFAFIRQMSKIEQHDLESFEKLDSGYGTHVVEINRVIHSFPVHNNDTLCDVYRRFANECSDFHSTFPSYLNGMYWGNDAFEHLMNAGQLLNELRDATASLTMKLVDVRIPKLRYRLPGYRHLSEKMHRLSSRDDS